MTATILQFRPRPRPAIDPDAHRIAVGRALARDEADISDDEARALALAFEATVAQERAATAGMAPAERRQRLASLIEDAIATATPRP